MTFILLLTALALSGIAAFYAVTGLVAIFASAMIPIAVMGSALEVAKLVVASWLYRRWSEINFLTKTYFTTALVILMLLTSMGIFGFLSKAHLDQGGEAGTNDIKIGQIERQIDREEAKIQDAEKVLAQLDQAVQVLIDYDRIRGNDGAIAVRESQKAERESLTDIISTATDSIIALEEQKVPLVQEKLELQLEIGPLKYIAEAIYGDEAETHFDTAVRWVILLIIFVFDPLAVMLVIAWNREVTRSSGKKPEGIVDEQRTTIPNSEFFNQPPVRNDAPVGMVLPKDNPTPPDEIVDEVESTEIQVDEPEAEESKPLNSQSSSSKGSDIYDSIARGKEGRPTKYENR